MRKTNIEPVVEESIQRGVCYMCSQAVDPQTDLICPKCLTCLTCNQYAERCPCGHVLNKVQAFPPVYV